MPTGEIKRLNTEQGTGYIRETGGDEDIFFHSMALTNDTFDRLREGQAVEFERQAFSRAANKSRAIKIRTVDLGLVSNQPAAQKASAD